MEDTNNVIHVEENWSPAGDNQTNKVLRVTWC